MLRRAGLAVLGAYVCLLGAVVHRQVWRAADVTWPWGLVAVVAVTFVVTRAAGQVMRLGAAWLALGWAAGLLALQWSPGGGYLVASDWLGFSYTVGCLGVIVLCVVLRPRLGQ
ncbi:MAG: hypothetical protein JWR55_2734 [Aeromicrobium sp.]|jgi:hypothetical protein|nr:hypothetical protein [Aeromicrobium sp.]